MDCQRECHHQYKRKQREKQLRIAEQRRRWGVQFFHTNGKIDTRWLGNRWNDQVLEAAKSRQVLCIGSVNNLASIQDKWRQHLTRMDTTAGKHVTDRTDEDMTREEIDHLTEEIAAISANAQMEQTMAIFDPVFQDIETAYDEMQRRQRRNEKLLHDRKQRALASDLAQSASRAGPRDSSAIEGDIVLSAAKRGERNQRKRQLVQAAKIPWHLLDQLAAERHKLAKEKMLFKTWRKVGTGIRLYSETLEEVDERQVGNKQK